MTFFNNFDQDPDPHWNATKAILAIAGGFILFTIFIILLDGAKWIECIQTHTYTYCTYGIFDFPLGGK